MNANARASAPARVRSHLTNAHARPAVISNAPIHIGPLPPAVASQRDQLLSGAIRRMFSDHLAAFAARHGVNLEAGAQR